MLAERRGNVAWQVAYARDVFVDGIRIERERRRARWRAVRAIGRSRLLAEDGGPKWNRRLLAAKALICLLLGRVRHQFPHYPITTCHVTDWDGYSYNAGEYTAYTWQECSVGWGAGHWWAYVYREDSP